jgi:hypothetical protein
MGTIFDIREPVDKMFSMKSPAGCPSFRQLSEIYPVTRGRLCQLAAQHGRDALSDPARLAKVIRDNRNRLVIALSNPAEIRRIRNEIKSLTTKA